MIKHALLLTLGLSTVARHAHAEDSEVDVRAFDYIDVVETADGSIWKGVLVEQTPNVQYKIATADGSLHVIKASDVLKVSKQKNRDYRGAGNRPIAGAAGGGAPVGGGDGVASSYQPSSGSILPPPLATSGPRIEPEMAFMFPMGVLGDNKVSTSFAPGIRFGYEHLFGNFGLAGGGMIRHTWWLLPGNTGDVLWTLETQAYARGAIHIGRATPYLGLALGVDTNYAYSKVADMSNTSPGFGMNISTGVAVAAAPSIGFELGADYHPGTDTISSTAATTSSVSYFALRLGATFRL